MSQRAPRFSRSLTFKIAVAAALLMLAFAWLRPKVVNRAFEMFSFHQEWLSPDKPEPNAIRMIMHDPRSAADPEIASALARHFAYWRGREELQVLFDRNNNIVARSPELDQVDPSVLTGGPKFRMTIGGEPVGTAFKTEHEAIYADGKFVGLIAVLSYELAIPSAPRQLFEDKDSSSERGLDSMTLAFPAGTDLSRGLEKEPLNTSYLQYRRIENVVSVSISVAMALLLGVSTSILVTRRLRRLTRDVEALDPDEESVDLFRVDGSDEISRLAASINTMRARIGGLVEGIRAQDERRREWIAQVNHDIRTPLTALSICLERAAAAARDDEPAAVREALTTARHDMRRVRSFVDDLSEIGRLSLRDELVIEPIQPLELIFDAARSVRALADHAGVTLEVDPHGPSDELQADGSRLMRACENLLGNAIRHAHNRVRIGTDRVADTLVIRVEDDGPGFLQQAGSDSGIPGPVELRSVYSRTTSADSTGLGLKTVERVAQAHGGQLQATNDVEGWTRVDLILPASNRGAPA